MVTVSKAALKARMLEYFRRVEETGEELVVTDRGRPVVRVTAVRAQQTASELFADVRGRVRYRGDVLAPTAAEWPET
ncbi:MAG: type II toxin-antitoxin system prevent-host-death family antitoxin [Deltaproteobacteria bacterium]|nr:type II toxin-antitoxin system prevent-host-death family antitoxin [Deltaproteobacteria bacterium]